MKTPILTHHLWLPALLMLTIASCTGLQQQVNENIPASTVRHPSWSHNAVLYEVNLRQYTPEGTINAFMQHLPRLQELGVDILWFMPVTPIGAVNRKGTFGSYYSVQDYTAINPEYGTLEDFRNMVNRAHELGMHVIIDWVANHTAWDHEWVKTNPDFYFKDEQGEFTPPHNTDWTDVIQLEYENRSLWDAMIGEMSWWLTETNIDGFRCDVAYLVPTEFWNLARQQLESIKPVFMLAEADHPELQENAFNAGYSWTSHHAMNRIARREDDVTALDTYFFDENMGNYPRGTYKIFFITNHDENSWQGSEFERMGDAVEAFAVLTHTVAGMPLIYSGQEAGLEKRLEFFEKDEIDWSNLQYQAFYKTLNDLKKNNKALWNGAEGGPMQRILTDNNVNVFSFVRRKGNDMVFVILNLSPESRTVNVASGQAPRERLTELFTGETIRPRQEFSVEMEPWGYRVYYK
jgi:glycosidase